MSDIEGRYKALIQPIKDIAANWDIDIAESLTEYLEDLDNLRISIDGGKSNLNFAEAALLIQGSTAVYSKKVEYLHQLVLQSLEFITNKKSSTVTTAQGKASKSIEDDDILFLDNDASFLLLDHIVEEGHNINLKASAPSNLTNQRNSRHSYAFDYYSRSHPEIDTTFPRPSLIFDLQNSFGSENNTSRVSMSLMHSILSDDHGSASLKLSTSMVDGSGALLLCGSYPTTSTGARFQPNNDRSSLQNSFHANTSFEAGANAGAHDMDMFGDDGGDHWGDGGGDDYDGYNGEGHGTEDVVADPFPYADTSAPMTLGTPAKASQPLTTVSAVPQASSSSSLNNVTTKRRAAPLKDMYAQLDPHQAVTTSKEARRGKTYKIPLALSKPPRNPAEPSLDHLYADIKVTNTATFLRSGAVPAKGLFDTSLLPILQLKRKQVRQARLASIRTSRAAGLDPLVDATGNAEYEHVTNGDPMQYQNLHLRLGGLESSVARMEQGVQGVLQNLSRVEEMWTQDYDDDNFDNGGGDYHMDDGGDDYEAPDNHASDRAGDVLSTAHGAGGADGADWAEETEEEALARRVANVLNEDLNQSNRSSYESICQKYIDNFNQGAHMFAKETQLSRRVAEWTQRLEPILQQQEESAQFDIHAYCETFLEGVDEAIVEHDEELEELEAAGIEPATGEVHGEVSFGEVVAGQSSAEVCRIFLACLQLVNHGSISITPSADVNQWTFLPETAVALKGTQSAASRSGQKTSKQSVATSSSEGRSKGAMHPFRIRRIATVKKSHIVSDIENYRAPSLNTTVRKGALKSALSGKGKGTKRVQMDMPSNITITI